MFSDVQVCGFYIQNCEYNLEKVNKYIGWNKRKVFDFRDLYIFNV